MGDPLRRRGVAFGVSIGTLRPGTLRTLSALATIGSEVVTATEVMVADHADSSLNRSTILDGAAGRLNLFLETGGETCPHPEWPLLRAVAEGWRDIVIQAS